MNLPSHILEYIENNTPDKAIVLLDRYLQEHEASAEAYFRRGKLHWRLGNRRLAINDYNHAVDLDPDSPAREALRLAMSIMDFYNKDLYNP